MGLTGVFWLVYKFVIPVWGGKMMSEPIWNDEFGEQTVDDDGHVWVNGGAKTMKDNQFVWLVG